MKHIFFFFFTALSLAANAQQVPRCQILGMEHFGGNKTDRIYSPNIITNIDGSFSLCIQHNSDSGSINKSCSAGNAQGYWFFRNYDANYTSLQNERCSPIGSNFSQPTFYVYPQANGDTILIGTSESPQTSYDIVIERRNGAVIWNKKYGSIGAEVPYVIVPTHDSGFLITCGATYAGGDVDIHYGSPFDADAWLLRLDKNGDKVWAKVLGGSYYDVIRTIIPFDDGSYYLFGSTASADYDATGSKGGSDLWVVKMDSAGNKQWHKCLGGSSDDGAGYDNGVFAIKDGYGGFYVLNRTASQDGDVQHRIPPSSDWEESDFWLLHIDSLANIIWETTYGGGGLQAPSGMCRATDGSLWLMGLHGGGLPPGGDMPDYYGDQDGWVAHTDTSGNLLNQRTLGAERTDELTMIHPLPDGTVLVGGTFTRSLVQGDSSPGFPDTEGDRDIFLAHLGPASVGIDAPDAVVFDWELYPNPAKDEMEVSINKLNSTGLMLSITDANGKQVWKQNIKSLHTKIATGQFANGIYFVSLGNSAGHHPTKKLIIQH